jgi:hypothetical protein
MMNRRDLLASASPELAAWAAPFGDDLVAAYGACTRADWLAAISIAAGCLPETVVHVVAMVARRALQYISPRVKQPRRCIDAAEGWTAGTTSGARCRELAEASVELELGDAASTVVIAAQSLARLAGAFADARFTRQMADLALAMRAAIDGIVAAAEADVIFDGEPDEDALLAQLTKLCDLVRDDLTPPAHARAFADTIWPPLHPDDTDAAVERDDPAIQVAKRMPVDSQLAMMRDMYLKDPERFADFGDQLVALGVITPAERKR